MNYEAFAAEDRRLVLLRGLLSAAQYRTNAMLLRRYAAAVGHSVSGDRIAADLAWLREQDLVQLQQAEGITVAELTSRGADVANGSAIVPGVARPQPGF